MSSSRNSSKSSLEIISDIMIGKKSSRQGVLNPVSSTTIEQMELTNSFFPEAHTNEKKMYELSRANYEILGYDGIMPVFSVVIEAAALGCKIDWGNPKIMPRVLGKIWKGYKDIKIPKNLINSLAPKAVLKSISLLKSKYSQVAIIGKVFGPWTLSYEAFGVEDFLIKTIESPREVKDILKKLSQITLTFAKAQIEAGADIITIADHATRDLCSPDSYKEYLISIHSLLASQIEVPTILHICGDTSDRIEYIRQTGITAFHFESKVDACDAVRKADKKILLIGNINNPSTLLFGSLDKIRADTEYAIKCGLDIIGPECAVPLNTPLKNLKEISRVVKNDSA